ncbi:unnamed protein product, partial [Staurois parvus]
KQRHLFSARSISAYPCHLPVPHQCHIVSVPISATCKCPSVLYQCPSELPFSATYQCQSVPPISAPVSAAYQCQTVPPISVHQCRLSVPVSAAYQCRLTVPVSAT